MGSAATAAERRRRWFWVTLTLKSLWKGGAVPGFRTPDRRAGCHVLNQELAPAGCTAALTQSAATLVTAEPAAKKTTSWVWAR